MRFRIVEDIVVEATQRFDSHSIFTLLSDRSVSPRSYLVQFPDYRDAVNAYCTKHRLNMNDYEMHHINGVHPLSKFAIDNDSSNVAMVTKGAHTQLSLKYVQIAENFVHQHIGGFDVNDSVGIFAHALYAVKMGKPPRRIRTKDGHILTKKYVESLCAELKELCRCFLKHWQNTNPKEVILLSTILQKSTKI